MVMDKEYSENKESVSNIPMRSISESAPLCSQETNTSKVRFPSCRLVLIVMGFLGFVNIYALRANLGVALVAMVNHTQQTVTDVSILNYTENDSDDICESHESTGATEFGKDDTGSGEFNWDSHKQGTVLAAFFYGYTVTQV